MRSPRRYLRPAVGSERRARGVEASACLRRRIRAEMRHGRVGPVKATASDAIAVAEELLFLLQRAVMLTVQPAIQHAAAAEARSVRRVHVRTPVMIRWIAFAKQAAALLPRRVCFGFVAPLLAALYYSRPCGPMTPFTKW